MDEAGVASAVPSNGLHVTYLDRSRKELENKVDELQKVLANDKDKLSAPALKSREPQGKQARKWQLDILAKAFQDLTAKEPFLPFPGSVLPALLALRSTDLTIRESKKYLLSQRNSLQEAKERVEIEQANLSDQIALTRALENRLQSLRHGISSNKDMTPDQAAREKSTELKQKIKELDTDTSKLLKSLKAFIDEPLAAMLAAEQIGGPVTGDMVEVDPEDLEAGFSGGGKRKKSTRNPDPGKRQRRIEEMLGGDQSQRRQDNSKPDKKTTAGEEMQSLTEDLMNRLVDSGGSTSDAYVQIYEESAAVRFLLRSKVAEYHPKDSQRLRLVDFGREIDD